MSFFHFTSDIPCLTPNNEEAHCLSLYECQPLLRALSTMQPQSLEFVRQSECGILKNFLVCCGTDGHFVSTNTSTLTTAKPDIDVRINSSNNYEDKFKLLASPLYCGYQAKDNRFSKDNETAMDEFPWMVLIQTVFQEKFVTRCTGTLISSRYMLTAANCFSGNET